MLSFYLLLFCDPKKLPLFTFVKSLFTMTCFKPLKAFLPFDCDKEGKRKLIFSERKLYEFKRATILKLQKNHCLPNFTIDEAFDLIYQENSYFNEVYFNHDVSDYPDGLLIDVPCGKCLGCQMDYSRSWATRAINEAYMHNHYKNCSFLSLTFNDSQLYKLDNPYSVSKIFFRSWIKRFRSMLKDYYKCEIRYLGCGEYGSKNLRPHYHLLVFGFNFPDKFLFKQDKVRGKLVSYYRSPFLEKCWSAAHSSEPYGYSVIGNVTFQSCAYVARYILKKHDKIKSGCERPFLCSSRMPGLGHDFCIQFLTDIFNSGFVSLPDGSHAPIPRFYETICEKIDPELYYNYKYDSLQRLYEKMISNIKYKKCTTQSRQNDLERLQKIKNDKLIRIIS